MGWSSSGSYVKVSPDLYGEEGRKSQRGYPEGAPSPERKEDLDLPPHKGDERDGTPRTSSKTPNPRKDGPSRSSRHDTRNDDRADG